ncbi:MAG: hypothetical protein Tsb009_04520 [Planctomycetaceae bacterium]
MAISKTRLIVRFALILFLVAVIGLGYLGWKSNQPEILWERSQAALSDGDVESSKLYLMKLIQVDPQNADARVALADILRDEASKGDKTATHAVSAKAVEHLAQAAKLRPEDPKILKPLLQAYLASNRPDDGKEIAASLLKVDSNDADALYVSALLAQKNNDLETAKTHLDKLWSLKNEPQIRTALLMAKWSVQAKDEKKLQQALSAGMKLTAQVKGKMSRLDLSDLDKLHLLAIEKSPNSNVADARMSLILNFEQRRAEVAKQVIPAGEQAIKLAILLVKKHSHPTDAKENSLKARRALLQHAVQLGSEAMKSEKSNSELEPMFVELVLALGDKNSTVKAAEESLARMQSRKKRNKEAELKLHRQAAELLVQLGRFASAEKHINALLKDDRTSGYGHLLAGTVASFEGRFDQARVHLEKARRQLTANHLMVRKLLGFTLASMGEWREALPYLESVAATYDKLTPKQRAVLPDLDLQIGANRLLQIRALFALNQPDKAQSLLKLLKGTRYEPAGIVLYVNDLWKNKRHAQAEKVIRDARMEHPKNLTLALLHAELLLIDEKADDAEKLVRDFAASQPDDLNAQLLVYQWLMRKKDYNGALDFIKKLQEKHPKQPALFFALARTKMALKDEAGAIKAAAELRQFSDWQAVADNLAAVLELRRQNLEGAAEFLDASGQSERRTSAFGLLKAHLNTLQGDPTAAIESVAGSLAFSRTRAAASRALLRPLLQLAVQKSPAEALKKLETLLAKYPKQPALLFAKSELQARLGQFVNAMQTLKTLEELMPNSGQPIYYQARLWAAMGRNAEALREAKRALTLAEDALSIRLLAIRAAMSIGQLQEALSLANEGLEKSPSEVRLSLLKANLLSQLNRKGEARQELVRMTKANPKSPQAWVALARMQSAEKDGFAAAAATLKTGYKQNPDSKAVQISYLKLLLESNKQTEADSFAKSIAGEKPKHSQAVALAEMFLRIQQFKRAQKWAEVSQSIAESSKNANQQLVSQLLRAQIHFQHGLAANSDKQLLAQARDGYEKILKKNSNILIAINNLAWLYAAQFNQVEKARALLDQLQQTVPLNRLPESVIDTIVMVYQKQGEWKLARKLVNEAIQIHPLNPNWVRMKVNLALQSGRLEKTIPELQKLDREQRWTTAPALGIARLNAALGKTETALNELNNIFNIAPHHLESHLLAIELASKLNNQKLVAQHAEAVLKQRPNAWKIHEQLATSLMKQDRTEDAKKVLDHAIAGLSSEINKNPTPEKTVQLSRFQFLRGQQDVAEKTLSDALQKTPHEFMFVLQGVEHFLKQKKYADAESFVSTHLAKDAPFSHVRAISKLFYDFAQYKTALKWAKVALKRAGEHEQITAHLLMGDVLLALGQQTGSKELFTQARGHFSAVIMLDPKNLLAGNNLAWILAHELNEPEEALKIIEQVRGDAPLDKLHVGFIDTIALVYRKNKRWGDAQKLLEQALTAYPKYAGLHFQLGLVYQQLEKPLDARRSLQNALQLGLNKDDEKTARKHLEM